MHPFRLFASTGYAFAQLESPDGITVQTAILLGREHHFHEGHIVDGVMCAAVDSLYPRRTAPTPRSGALPQWRGRELLGSDWLAMPNARVL